MSHFIYLHISFGALNDTIVFHCWITSGLDFSMLACWRRIPLLYLSVASLFIPTLAPFLFCFVLVSW